MEELGGWEVELGKRGRFPMVCLKSLFLLPCHSQIEGSAKLGCVDLVIWCRLK